MWDDDYDEDEEPTREDRDDDIYASLVARPDPYAKLSVERNIQIGRDFFSLRWILSYAQARNAGIACTYTSLQYANRRLYGGTDWREYHEWTETFHRYRDKALLWQAHLHYCRNGKKKAKRALAVAA